MNISATENLRTSLEAVWAHRLRSLLTVLGIVIGITTVVTVASLLTGIRKSVVSFFEELGPDNIFLAKSWGGGPGDSKEKRRPPFKPEYAETIKRWCPSTVADVATTLNVPPDTGAAALSVRVPGFESDNINIEGQTANIIKISPREIKEGRFLTSEEDERGARVAVIGPGIADSLFPRGNYAGRTIMLDGGEYTVVGVFGKAKLALFGDNGLDNQIVIPLRTARRRYPQLNDFQFQVNGVAGKRKDAYDEVHAVMRRIRQLPPKAEDNFEISTPDQIIKQFDSITGLIGVVAIAISALGLLVGGIGVMNIMLVSVTERTREIGVRKALGARRRDIVIQFLFEAMTVTGVGGVLGILFSILVTVAIGLLVPTLPSVVPLWAVITGFTVSVAIGLFFGVWPATKASRLDPVVALRYE